MSHVLINAIQRTAAGLAIIAAIAASAVSPARAGSVITSDCLRGFGYDHDFSRSRSYNNTYGDGYIGGNANASGSGSSSGYGSRNCVEIRRELTNPYVIQVLPQQGEKDVAEADAHERQWRTRCHPTAREDAYGVRRYHYAAPGCEYGRYE